LQSALLYSLTFYNKGARFCNNSISKTQLKYMAKPNCCTACDNLDKFRSNNCVELKSGLSGQASVFDVPR